MSQYARLFVLVAAWMALLPLLASAAEPRKVRLFILSGQSNMARLNPDTTFTPALKTAFPGDEVIVVKSAQGEPIRRWYKNWKPPEGVSVKKAGTNGDLYDVLMAQVRKAIADRKVDTVSFVWMQGENDAKTRLSAVYPESLRGLAEQLRSDLRRTDITIVIGRLSDFDLKNPHWKAIRDAQVAFGEKEPLAAWVDTDDLNGDKKALHYTRDGYDKLGSRFAVKTIELLKKGARRD